MRLVEQGLHPLSELREVGVGALAMEQRAAKLIFERFDRTRERGLRDTAALGGAGEVQLLAEREKIADLMQFHRTGPWASRHRSEMDAKCRVRIGSIAPRYRSVGARAFYREGGLAGPGHAHCLLHQRADARRVGPAAHGDEGDLAP